MGIKRSLPQVIFRHLPGSLFYDEEEGLLGRVIDVVGNSDTSIDINRLADRVRAELDRWKASDEKGACNIFPEDIGYIQPSDIEVIIPGYVEWEVFPYYFRCKRTDECGIWQYSRDVVNNEGHCLRCGYRVEQTPYVWVHNCGRLAPLAPGKNAHCPRHQEHSLYMNDTRSFATSTWRCRECGHESSVRFLGDCQCGSKQPRPQPMRWNDPGVFSVASFQMINLPQEYRHLFYIAPNRDAAISAVLSSALVPGEGIALNTAQGTGSVCPNCGEINSVSDKFCSQCGAQISHPVTHVQPANDSIAAEALDHLVTFALLWDLPGTKSLRFKERWDPANQFGVDDLIHLEQFPISLVGLGYRRQRSKPPATLCLFSTNKPTKKMRVFTYSASVEAYGIRLNAECVFKWLIDNQFVNGTVINKDDSHQSALAVLNSLVARDTTVEKVITGLLHTISHACIIGLSWCSGMDLTSFSESLLPEALVAVVHAGDSSLGGLSSVFLQTPWQPLEMASEDLIACQLDPGCSQDDGGSCVACLHIPLGCDRWNSELSRAYLFGGRTKEGNDIKQGFWQR